MDASVLLEDVRVSSHQLVDNRPKRVVDREQPSIGRDLGEKHPFENVVADLLAQVVHIPALDGVDDFVRFLEHEARQRFERLFPIPRAAVRRAQRAHDGHQLLECLASL